MSTYLNVDELGIEYTSLRVRENSLDNDEVETLESLIEFAEECGFDPDDSYNWDDVGPGIAKDSFVEYAKELAADIGAINNDDSWPNNCIDWEYAARELAYDYSLVDWQGTEYYVRDI